MGISAFLLFKRGDSAPVNDLLRDLKKICIEEKLFFDSDEETYDSEGTLKYTRVYISDLPFRENYSRTLCFSVYDEPYEYQFVSFEWDDTQNEYFKAVVSDDFDDNEDLLLRFSHAILKVHPTAKIWVEEEWFYTLEDLENITNMPYMSDWCYKNPREIARD
ncbi:hypothetical protein M4D81_05555 [Paenibacillus sp. p3-SID867]|uniref:hypothetical protein n=1 Tax=Paenibacillus sp. p3-SID867 TaxID=2916363 RepID=UPI0021A6F83A|nr:hypothetical protein [Paenibacillus sp. p3-SID867]MCT1398469.1 hypothetical protein [Paenibacillus sp. p3-SID867]